ncbi:hypothetical protein DPMN_092092 [Dreissena polymorpha]|uniref:Uncharacterized protein n=1 Tax=Dreissena polymorpha TaxID=45954 RepID=A0A9D4QZU1_DREPO|nr:hypothetical protein DPMN_092092 [Dreissena polymorpha]
MDGDLHTAEVKVVKEQWRVVVQPLGGAEVQVQCPLTHTLHLALYGLRPGTMGALNIQNVGSLL